VRFPTAESNDTLPIRGNVLPSGDNGSADSAGGAAVRSSGRRIPLRIARLHMVEAFDPFLR